MKVIQKFFVVADRGEVALVLIIGVLISMFSAITVTRSILRVVVSRDWARKAALYGVTEQEFVARTPGRTSLRREARSRV